MSVCNIWTNGSTSISRLNLPEGAEGAGSRKGREGRGGRGGRGGRLRQGMEEEAGEAVDGRGRQEAEEEKAHKLFQHKLFAPHPKPSHFWAPREKFICLTFLGKNAKKGTHINFFGGILGVKNGVPNGPFSATKSLVCCFFLPLVRLGLSGRNSRKIPERPRKRSHRIFWNAPREYGWLTPKPYNSRHLKPPEQFQNSLPFSTAGDVSFLEVVLERASQSWS